ncbi:MAG TPA: hypothetical protein VJN18_18435 [Polyangiaceae bacterium]|nr:hypothetical protein [Polyangiaceae bacterium]
MRLAVPFVVFAVACASPPRSTPSQLRSSEVLELAALPPGYTAGETLNEHCTGFRGFRAIEEEQLGDVDCSFERVSRALRARAAELESRIIVGKRCQVRAGRRFSIMCSATRALPTASLPLGFPAAPLRGPAPSAAQVLDLDEPFPRQSAKIRVSFLPEAGTSWRPARAYHRVDETARPSVGRVALGQVSARCSDCDAMSLRHALRVTAGRVGAGEVASVRCFQDAEDQRCVGTALEPWSF